MMYKKSFLQICLWSCLWSLSTCSFAWDDAPQKYDGFGLRPVYVSRTELENIQTKAPQALQNPGKIYIRGNYLFVNERQQGVHIINNSNPAQPQKLAFVQIPGNIDIAVKGNFLYADNGPDLLVLDIGNPEQVQLKRRIRDAFPPQVHPEQTNVYFECVDVQRGIVIGWENTLLTGAECFR